MAEIHLDAELRNEFGKGAARRIRRADKVPAVLYGHGTDPVHLTLPGHETLLALRQANALLSLHIDGADDRLALPKQVQRDPIKGFVKHVDLLLVKRGEKVTVEVPLGFVGIASPDAILNEERTTLSVQAEITNIPQSIEVSVQDMQVGDQILAGAIALPSGCELEEDPEQLIIVASAQVSEAAYEAELGEEETEAESPADANAEAPAADEDAES